MSKLLYIQASPRQERSHSRAAADAFVDAYREEHPEDEIVELDLFKTELPAFDGLAVQAKYTILHGKEHSDEERAAWAAVEEVIDEFKSADKYVLAVPMWNFGVPYRLKQYMDLLIQPGYTFSYSPDEGYKGLVAGKPVLVVHSRGGVYDEASGTAGMDFEKPYLELALGFIGFSDIRSIAVEPTLMGGPDVASQKREAAVAEATALAKGF